MLAFADASYGSASTLLCNCASEADAATTLL